MVPNILELSRHEFNSKIVSQLAAFVNEDPAKTQQALESVLPALLAGLVNKGTTPQGATDILNMIAKGDFGADTLKGLSASLMGGESTNNLLNSGSVLLEGTLGERLNKTIDWIHGSSGINKSSAYSLLSLTMPAVLGLLGTGLKGSNMNAHGMMNLLASQTGFIQSMAPQGLASAMGLSNLSERAKGVATPTPTGSSLWRLIIPLIIIVGLLLFISKTCTAPQTEVQQKEAPMENTAEMAAEELPPAGDIGEFISVKLPNGSELNVPELGIERRLMAFIEANSPVDETTWFTFDRLEFETGSTALEPSSTEQLANIAEILRAYPQVTLKIGGYTDNTGNPEANLALSRQRAERTMQALIALGVDAGRLQAEGYGENYPVADNSTEEGRQQNRRIDIRVTGK